MPRNRFIPADVSLTVRNEPKFRAELVVYDQLRDQLDAAQRGWTVVYQAGWLLKNAGQDEPKEGEANFVIAHPGHGVLVVEVKGGAILFEDGRWYSRDRTGAKHEIIPFTQVARNARNLARKLNELSLWKAAPVGKLGRLVVFPDSATPAGAIFPSDVSTDIVIDKAGLGDLKDGLLRACRFWFGDSWQHRRSSQVADSLVSLFGKPLEFTDSLSANLPLEERRFEKLTDDQFRVVQSAAKLRRVAVWGGAGSGKTWLARKRVLQLAAEGFRTLLLCRSEPLSDHLRLITESENDLEISDYHGLMSLFGGSPDDQKMSVNDPNFGCRLLELLDKSPDIRFSAIMVDEGQDFRAEEWDFIEAMLRDPKRDVLYVFLDDNQQVYPHRTTLPDGLVELHLGDNVRTTRSIHERMREWYRGDAPQRPLGPLGRKVQHVSAGDDMLKSLRNVVGDLIQKDQIAPEHIVVLTPCNTTSSELHDITLIQGRRLTPTPRASVDVRLSSIADFKGLESPVVVLAELDRLPSDEAARSRLCYVAFSRPRSHLVVMGDI